MILHLDTIRNGKAYEPLAKLEQLSWTVSVLSSFSDALQFFADSSTVVSTWFVRLAGQKHTQCVCAWCVVAHYTYTVHILVVTPMLC